MNLKELINDIALNQRAWKPKTHQWNGNIFRAFVHDGSQKALVSERIFKDTTMPTLLIWRRSDSTIIAGWLCQVYAEMVGARLYNDNRSGLQGMLIHDYFLFDPTIDFKVDHDWDEVIGLNVEQAESMIDKTYYDQHEKYTDVYSANGYVYLTYRDKFTKKRHKKLITNFEWYFYILKEDYDKMMEILKEANFEKFIRKSEPEGDKWIKVFVFNDGAKDFNDQRRKMKDPAYMVRDTLIGRIPTYEADLTVAERYAIDNELKVETDVKICYYDIETDDTERRIDVENTQILSIGGVASDREDGDWKCTVSESNLMEWWKKYVRDYDILIGYNSYNFDMPAICARSKEHGSMYWPTFRFARHGHIDLMKRIIGTYGRLMGLRSYKLNDIGQQFVGEEKVEHTETIRELFDTNRPKLKKYNLQDCYLLKKIDNKLGLTELMIAMCEWTGAFPTMFKPTKAISGISVSKLLDTYILRNAKGTGIHYPTAVWDDTAGEKFEGGLVMEAIPGRYTDVYILDFKSLYPTIIWSWKISPENVRYDDNTKEELVKSTQPGVWFYKNRVSIFPHLVDSLMKARKTYKNLMFQHDPSSQEYKKYNVMQQVAKELTNSLYGQVGQRGNRYFNYNVAGSVTGAGRWLLRRTKVICERLKHKVIYGDTDSVFVTEMGDVNPNDLIDVVNKELTDLIRKEFNIGETNVELEYEKKFSKFIQVAGKNYAGLLTELDGKAIDKIMIKGLACVKRSTINRAKKEQEALIEMLLREEHDVEFYKELVSKKRREWFTCIATADEIMVKVKVGKPPEDYATELAHVRVAKQLQLEGKEFWVGMQVPYIIIDKKLKLEVHADDFKGKYDKSAYWEKIYSPMMAVLQVCFKEVDWGYYKQLKATKPKKPKCPLCGYVKCRCHLEDEKKEVIEMKPTKKGRFVIKKTQFNKLDL